MNLVLTAIIYSILVLALGIFITIPFSSWIALKVGAIDLPGEIKVHSQPTPRLGGLGILLTAISSISGLLAIVDVPTPVSTQLAILLASLFGLGIIGYLDDVYKLKPLIRLIVEGIIAVIFSISLLGIQINLLLLCICCFWIVGLINAYNFLDGLDGLAASVATVNLLALAIMLFVAGDSFLGIVAGTFALAICGFLRFNWPPASIFMGDIGSISLGFIIAAISLILVVNESWSLEAIVAVILAAILPLGDLIATVLRRLIKRKPLFQGDRGHFYDVLVDRLGLLKPQATYFSLFMALIAGGLSIIVFISFA